MPSRMNIRRMQTITEASLDTISETSSTCFIPSVSGMVNNAPSRPSSDSSNSDHWLELFDKLDQDGTGTVELTEFLQLSESGKMLETGALLRLAFTL